MTVTRQRGDAWVLDLTDCHDPAQVGGKAINLARLIRAGFNVPGGFVLTTAACTANRELGSIPEDLRERILDAYAALGRPTVAVRSSATAEDTADASMAGQYETILNVQGDTALIDAIHQCWQGLDSPRVRSYLARHDLRPEQVAMAVVVQTQVAADVAGVLFTAHPQQGTGRMLVEASWGLGEGVVSGLVQPDTLELDAATGEVLTCQRGSGETALHPGNATASPHSEAPHDRACLTAQQVLDLWELGKSVASHFNAPQDIEWAFEGDALYLLQSRAITTLSQVVARERCIAQTQAALRAAVDAGRGPWVVHNLGETLPHPTPLSWDVLQRFMSGSGGFGTMYRMVGFEPAPTVAHDGFLDRILGRVYMDLSRASEMFFESFPFAYDAELLRNDPGAAQQPPTLPVGSLRDRRTVTRRMVAVNRTLDELAADFDQQLDTRLIPEFQAWVREQKRIDLAALSADDWLALWRQRETRVMDEFGPRSLLPSLILTRALESLRAFLDEHAWDEDATMLTQQLAIAEHADSSVRSAQLLREAAADPAKLTDWLNAFGHRAPGEFDLGVPRWRERPDEAATMAERLASAPPPEQRHAQQAAAARAKLDDLAATLAPADVAELKRRVDTVHRYQRFREDGKCELMRGYDLLRDLVLEAQRRLGIGNEACLLSLEELHRALQTGIAPLNLLRERRATRDAEASLEPTAFIDSGDLATLGADVPIVDGSAVHRGLPVSDGRGRGPVRIVLRPEDAGELGDGYILVCPSTDPNWTPLFAGAAGLVIERGGALSHGAVVAREMGVPAVVLPNATRILREGEAIQLDGRAGIVTRDGDDTASVAADRTSLSAAQLKLPPPVGERERAASRLIVRSLLVWAVFLAAVFLLPQAWLHEPTMRVLDELLLPLAAAVGKPATVGLVAVAFACLCMVGQRVLTDTPRLRVAVQRSKELRRQAAQLDQSDPQRREFMRAASGVQQRTLLASFVPLAVLLGPMLMTFFWFPVRFAPGWHNAPPGTTVYVTATVQGDHTQPVTLKHDDALRVDATTPSVQTLRPIRATLERLRQRWQQPSDLSHLSTWEEKAGAIRTREHLLADLGAFLAGPMPASDLAWTVQTPVDHGGRFPLTIETQGHRVRTVAVLGDRFAPEPREVRDPTKPPMQIVTPNIPGPIVEVRLAYRQPPARDAHLFWQPLAFLGIAWNAGWLMTYLIAYLPAMFLFRFLLRVP